MVGLDWPETDALNCCVAPVVIAAVAGVMLTFPTMVTVALALLVVSATLVAVTVCDPDWLGAGYIPVALIVPVPEFPPPTLSTDHVTVVLLVPVTVAVNCC